MESFEDHLDSARRSLKVAEHMLTRTYPIVDDPKLILAVAEDVYNALVSSMDALLLLKEGELPEAEDFSQRFDAFRQAAAGHGFSDEEFTLLSDLAGLMHEHKESPVEFARKDKFVICDEGYNCSTLSLDDMKKYLFRAGLFVAKVEGILNKDRTKAENG